MKIPTGRPAKHPVDFMMAVAQKVVSGELTLREAAQRYGVSHGSVSLWKKRYGSRTLHLMKQKREYKKRKTAGGRESALESEIRVLKQELGDLYMQIQMLKKAQVFSERAKKDSSSIVTSENLNQSAEDVE